MIDITEHIATAANLVTTTLREGFQRSEFQPKAPEDNSHPYSRSLIAASIVFSFNELQIMAVDREHAIATVAEKFQLLRRVLEDKTPSNYKGFYLYVREPQDLPHQLVKQWVVAVLPIQHIESVAGYDEFYAYEDEVRELKYKLKKETDGK